jgi:hypothetical protein
MDGLKSIHFKAKLSGTVERRGRNENELDGMA